MASGKGPAVGRSGYSKTVVRSGIGIRASYQGGQNTICLAAAVLSARSHPARLTGRPVPSTKERGISIDFLLFDQEVSANSAALI